MTQDEIETLNWARECWGLDKEPEPVPPPYCRPVFPEWKGGMLWTGRGDSALFSVEISKRTDENDYGIYVFDPGGRLLGSAHVDVEKPAAALLRRYMENFAVNRFAGFSTEDFFRVLTMAARQSEPKTEPYLPIGKKTAAPAKDRAPQHEDAK